MTHKMQKAIAAVLVGVSILASGCSRNEPEKENIIKKTIESTPTKITTNETRVDPTEETTSPVKTKKKTEYAKEKDKNTVLPTDLSFAYENGLPYYEDNLTIPSLILSVEDGKFGTTDLKQFSTFINPNEKEIESKINALKIMKDFDYKHSRIFDEDEVYEIGKNSEPFCQYQNSYETTMTYNSKKTLENYHSGIVIHMRTDMLTMRSGMQNLSLSFVNIKSNQQQQRLAKEILTILTNEEIAQYCVYQKGSDENPHLLSASGEKDGFKFTIDRTDQDKHTSYYINLYNNFDPHQLASVNDQSFIKNNISKFTPYETLIHAIPFIKAENTNNAFMGKYKQIYLSGKTKQQLLSGLMQTSILEEYKNGKLCTTNHVYASIDDESSQSIYMIKKYYEDGKLIGTRHNICWGETEDISFEEIMTRAKTVVKKYVPEYDWTDLEESEFVKKEHYNQTVYSVKCQTTEGIEIMIKKSPDGTYKNNCTITVFVGEKLPEGCENIEDMVDFDSYY